jgi:anti-sigma B factor antagonist
VASTAPESPIPSDAFRCDMRLEPDHALIAVAGEIDVATVLELDQILLRARDRGANRLVVDLRDVTFMDTTGISVLVRWTRVARRAGFRFTVIPGEGAARRVLDLTGVLETLDLADEPPVAEAECP